MENTDSKTTPGLPECSEGLYLRYVKKCIFFMFSLKTPHHSHELTNTQHDQVAIIRFLGIPHHKYGGEFLKL